MKFPEYKTPQFRIWFGIWITIYLLINITGLFAPSSDILTIIKLGGVILCFVYALRIYPEDRLLQAAMFTTCIADLILAAKNTSEAGIIVFFITQIIHLIRLDGEHLKTPLTIFTGSFCVVILLDLWLQLIPLIFVVSTFYAVAILMNIIVSYHWYHQSPKNPHARFALIGFILFACCDSCTVVSYLSLTGVLAPLFYGPANFMAWFFYYPSQIFVSNSSRCATIGSKEGKCKLEVYGR